MPGLIKCQLQSHTPPEMKHWPALPWIVRSILVPYVLAKRHSGWDRIFSEEMCIISDLFSQILEVRTLRNVMNALKY